MRKQLLSFLTLICCTASAQTYYYINAITVNPPSPTTADDVMVTLNGDLSNTAAIINGTSFLVNGFSVNIIVSASQPGIGLDVLTPHQESFDLGPLPAGTYTITIDGQFIQDLAPSAQHQFIVSGGDEAACDSVVIYDISWQPFTDTALEVFAGNLSQECFDYPQFILLNGTDTVAEESVNFFCLPSSASHVLDIGSAGIPEVPFSGELHLWTAFLTTPACIFDVNVDLCPDTACRNLIAYVQNVGDALSNAVIQWYVNDDNGTAVAEGQFALSGSQQSDADTMCLPPGHYTLVAMSGVPLTGGQLILGVGSGHQYAIDRMIQLPPGAGGGQLPFTFYGPCIDPDNGLIENMGASGLSFGYSDGAVIVRSTGEGSIGRLELLDHTGRLLRILVSASSTAFINVSDLASGMYIIRTDNHGSGTFIR